MRRIFGFVLSSYVVVAGALLAQPPAVPTTTPQQTTSAASSPDSTAPPPATATANTDTTARGTTGSDTEGKKSEDSLLKTSHIVVAIIAALLGGIFMSLINIGINAWKGLSVAVFAPLRTDAGREALIKLIQGELAKKPEELMKLIHGELKKDPKELMTLIHKEMNSPEGHAAIAGYALAHFRIAGRKEFQDFLLGILDSREAEEQMTKIVVRLTTAQKIVGQGVAVAREVAKPLPHELERTDRAVQESTIGEMGDNPIANEDELAQKMEQLAAEMRARAQSKTFKADGRKKSTADTPE